MKNKILCESLEQFILENKRNPEFEPLALAVLGAPAGGKSYTIDKIKDFVKDQRVSDTLDKGVVLTIDKLRAEFQSKKPLSQMVGFVRAFYYMRKKAKQVPDEYEKWFKDIISLWGNKIAKLAPDLKVTVDKNHVYFDGEPAYKSLKKLRTSNYSPNKLIYDLDKYDDYKRVIRYFQNIKQKNAISKQFNISYDESGDEPKKIIRSLKQLHKSGYVTDVFLIHPKNIASNLIQNFYRVVTGGDGGRDSSEAIIQSYLNIEKNKHIYKTNAEDVLKTNTTELKDSSKNKKIRDKIENANVPDDIRRGDKPIDVFTEVEPMTPLEAFKIFSEKLDKEKNLLFISLLKYALNRLQNIPENAKQILIEITKSIDNKQALQIIKQSAQSGKYIFKHGGITPKLVKNAETALK